MARRLAADRSALRLTKDEWLIALGSNPWDEPTQVKLEGELWNLAQEVLRLGLSVVLDFGLWARIERDEFRAAARGLGVGVELHYLEVPTDELWRRIDAVTQNRLGTATRSAARTSTSGQRRSKHLMPPSWPCSIPHQDRTDPLPRGVDAEHCAQREGHADR